MQHYSSYAGVFKKMLAISCTREIFWQGYFVQKMRKNQSPFPPFFPLLWTPRLTRKWERYTHILVLCTRKHPWSHCSKKLFKLNFPFWDRINANCNRDRTFQTGLPSLYLRKAIMLFSVILTKWFLQTLWILIFW